MKVKRGLAMLLSLACCLALMPSALADDSMWLRDSEKRNLYTGDGTDNPHGDGWAYDNATHTLTLNNFVGSDISFGFYGVHNKLKLADGSVNKVGYLGLSVTDGDMTIEGNGELIVYSEPMMSYVNGKPNPIYSSPFGFDPENLKLASNLVITGGVEEGTSEVLKMGKAEESGRERDVMLTPDGKVAYYIRIAPSGATPAQKPAQTNTITATSSSSKVQVNGKSVTFDAYNIDGNNYFKLRDLAYTLNGTDKQFEVSWDESANAISLTTDKAYTAAGGEMQGKASGKQTAAPTTSKLLLDGKEISVTAYKINGNNYFKLRDLGEQLDFSVSWDEASRTIAIDTTKNYTPE